MSHEEYAVLVEVLRRAPVTLAERLVLGALLEKLAPQDEQAADQQPSGTGEVS